MCDKTWPSCSLRDRPKTWERKATPALGKLHSHYYVCVLVTNKDITDMPPKKLSTLPSSGGGVRAQATEYSFAGSSQSSRPLFLVGHPVSVLIFFENALETVCLRVRPSSVGRTFPSLCVSCCLRTSQTAYVGFLINFCGRCGAITSPSVFLSPLASTPHTLSAVVSYQSLCQVLPCILIIHVINPTPSLPFRAWTLPFSGTCTAAPARTTTSSSSEDPALG